MQICETNLPTPALVKYMVAGQPMPPAPTIKMLDDLSFSCAEVKIIDFLDIIYTAYIVWSIIIITCNN